MILTKDHCDRVAISKIKRKSRFFVETFRLLLTKSFALRFPCRCFGCPQHFLCASDCVIYPFLLLLISFTVTFKLKEEEEEEEEEEESYCTVE